MIRLEKVTKIYPDGTQAVNNVSFEVQKGELCVLLDPSGCGKTTTMKMINRLISVTNDRIFIDRMDNTPGASLIALKEHKTDIAMVFGTDASIAKYGWHVYSDDKSFFPPHDLTPYVRKDTLVKHPEIAGILNKLVATFPGGGKPATHEIAAECRKVWQKLNAEVDIEKMEPGEVAHKYLYQRKLKR
ncbi:MAG: ATP-binding cassette domain-containing protein [Deltaproteobacteria bacterium]|nr:ATP-binding cassette domain-containing protein [Deltaproteobacteria bacterium]MBW1719619.1 ATP-binding cassette domain-containing protein [Deltaproteobacteria bacterium]MBW1932587.1 ATP-binding cassette domain-containing protein [Deltaproteobacteria bacterium]MBW1937723.1 ATP-binding cassette domain-containing protein [Deltaproteobacteria bacterium]MBW1964697.1 ATP-binding cassette domain-containing protein [Deltaproteobacteria bacterium]